MHMRPSSSWRSTICLSLLSAATLAAVVPAQRGGGAPQRPPINQSDDPILKDFRFRSIGPAVMGGRIDDIEAVESNPSTFYVGFATGGLWKTVNAGTTFEPLFDTYPVASIGDIAVSQNNPDTVWVGTGEPNNRQSSSFGYGVYKSTDGGESFRLMGLEETQTVSRIVIDPRDDDTVYIAANGHLFGPNPERGVFKTTDGGQSWSKVLFVNADTGVTDLVMHPTDNRTLFAATYQRRRTPWGFNGGGQGSGIFKSTDAGANWTRLENGLPDGTIPIGRIGLAMSRSQPDVLVAQIELARLPGQRGRGARAAGGRGRGQAQAAAARGGRGGRRGGGGNTPDPTRSGTWRSEDNGTSFNFMNNSNNRPMYYSQVRIDPSNDEIIWTAGSQLYKSTDGGQSFDTVQGPAHVDHHAIWIDPNNGDHVLLGNDGGIDVTWDGGQTWDFINTIAVGQFYAIGVDMRRPYYVYGGLQDNGSWGGPSKVRNGVSINADWFRVGGGDGFYVQVDPTNHNIVFAESQNGNIRRLDMSTGESRTIRPRGPGGGGRGGRGGGGNQQGNIVPPPPSGTQYRFHWNSPMQISPHNPRTIYYGGNAFFKSVNHGDTWMASKDLTRNIDRNTLSIMGVAGDDTMASKNDGTSNWGTITTLAESPHTPDIVWIGTDDGVVQYSRDGGKAWTNVTSMIPGLSQRHTVSRVEPSRFDAQTCYITFDGHLSDDQNPHVMVTRDFGQTWQDLSGTLPDRGAIKVIEEDTKNPNLLFLGTEYAIFASLDGGREWKKFMNNFPTTRVDDLVIHPREQDLVVGTHGRSIWIVDDITALQQMTDEVMEQPAALMDIRPAVAWKTETRMSRGVSAARHFRAENAPTGTAIAYYLSEPAGEEVQISISDINGEVVRTMTGPADAGLHKVQWNLRRNPPEGQGQGGGRGRRGGGGGQAVSPGTYRVTLTVGQNSMSKTVQVLEDIWMK